MASLESVASRLNVGTSVERAADGSVQLQEEDESVACVCPNVEWVFGDGLSAGTGTLYLTTR